MGSLCYNCKGKLKCGRAYCEVYEKSRFMFKSITKVDDNFLGSSPPSVFVGSKLPYPNVNVGILSPPNQVENAWMYDDPKYWVRSNFGIKQIMKLRSNLINSRFKSNIYDVRKSTKFLDIAQEVGMASGQVDIEVELRKKINLKLDFDRVNLPSGPRAPLKNVKITEKNTKISTKVDKVFSDSDLKAVGALDYLYKKDFDETTLSKLLSLGIMGMKKNRKLVPTRHSITAVDDTLGKFLLKKIRDYKQINEYQMFFGHYLGNYYLVMFFPEVLEYELFETYLPGSNWNPSDEVKTMTDYETFKGRKNYASNTVGGYYASRLGALEHLDKVKRQASMLILRFETPDYWLSLGVFVVREAMRKTMQTTPIIFSSKEEMLKEAENKIMGVLKFDIKDILKQSKVLNNLKSQSKLHSFFDFTKT